MLTNIVTDTIGAWYPDLNDITFKTSVLIILCVL